MLHKENVIACLNLSTSIAMTVMYSNLGLGKPASASWLTPFSGVRCFSHNSPHALVCSGAAGAPAGLVNRKEYSQFQQLKGPGQVDKPASGMGEGTEMLWI